VQHSQPAPPPRQGGPVCQVFGLLSYAAVVVVDPSRRSSEHIWNTEPGGRRLHVWPGEDISGNASVSTPDTGIV